MGNVVVRTFDYRSIERNEVEVRNYVYWSSSYAAGGDAIQTTTSVGQIPDSLKIAPGSLAGDMTAARVCEFEGPVMLGATGTLTASAQPSAGETVTIGNTVYTFAASSVGVLIGASLTATLVNLKAAINGESGYGTTYPNLLARNDKAEALSSSGTTVVLRAIHPGTKGNSVATTETMANASFGATTLTGGADWVDRTPILKRSTRLAQLIVTSTGVDDTAAADRSLYAAIINTAWYDTVYNSLG